MPIPEIGLDLAKGIAGADGARAEMDVVELYPLTENDPAEIRHTVETLTGLFARSYSHEGREVPEITR